mgnify:CR=1 FL=1
MNTPPSKCFHNGIILIVICFQICVNKYTYNFLILLYFSINFFYVYILNIIIP